MSGAGATGGRGALHIVGAGLAGLSAALAGVEAGMRPVLHEAAPRPGGRCGSTTSADGTIRDRGTHVLMGCNPRALAFVAAIGATPAWVEPEPDGLPLVDLATGEAVRVALSARHWLDPRKRPPGWRWSDLAGLLRLAAAGTLGSDATVAAAYGDRPSLRSLVEPLTLAALDTPAGEASAARMAPVLRRLALPGGGRVLVASAGLDEGLVGPAVARVASAGVPLRTGRRLRRIIVEDGRALALDFGDERIAVGPEDAVVLALPPRAIGRLLPGLEVPTAHEAIVNLHMPARYAGPVRFVGLLGGTAHWLLLRPGHVSVTVSAARGLAEEEEGTIRQRLHPEVEAGLAAALGTTIACDAAGAVVIKERQATVRQAVGDVARTPTRPLINLALAGDWLSFLPATIEAAIRSGEAAVATLAQDSDATAFVFDRPASKAARSGRTA